MRFEDILPYLEHPNETWYMFYPLEVLYPGKKEPVKEYRYWNGPVKEVFDTTLPSWVDFDTSPKPTAITAAVTTTTRTFSQTMLDRLSYSHLWEDAVVQHRWPKEMTPSNLHELNLAKGTALMPPEYTDLPVYRVEFTEHIKEYEISKAEEKLIGQFLGSLYKWRRFKIKHRPLWSKKSPGRMTYFPNKRAILQNRRTAVKLSAFLQRIGQLETTIHVADPSPPRISEYSHKLAVLHNKQPDNYELHKARNENDIIAMYEDSNHSSCMTRDRDGEYIHHRLDAHPVQAYDCDDIDVFGLWDTHQNLYVARCVANAKTKRFMHIYPRNSSQREVAYMHQMLHNEGYIEDHSGEYLDGCKIKFLNGEAWGAPPETVICPYIDGDEHTLVVDWEACEAVISADTREFTRINLNKKDKRHYSFYGPHCTSGFTGENDTDWYDEY